MTLIVGLVENGAVHMATDSGVWDTFEHPTGEAKMFRHGPLLIAWCGSVRNAQVVRYCLPELPPRLPHVEPEAYLVREFVPCLGKALAEHAALIDGDMDGNLLVGYAGQLFQVAGNFCLCRTRRGYAATGHLGAVGIALGVLGLTAASDAQRHTPQQRLQRALDIALDHTDAVRRPWCFETLESLEPAPALEIAA